LFCRYFRRHERYIRPVGLDLSIRAGARP
jgi:hypothetical protein